MNQCFTVTKEDEFCLVKNVLNHFANKEYFSEMVQSICFNKGGDYELDEVPGIASWGNESKTDLAKTFNFNSFSGIRFFYDHDLKGGIQESDYQDIELVQLVPLLLQAIAWNSKKHPNKLGLLRKLEQALVANGK